MKVKTSNIVTCILFNIQYHEYDDIILFTFLSLRDFNLLHKYDLISTRTPPVLNFSVRFKVRVKV